MARDIAQDLSRANRHRFLWRTGVCGFGVPFTLLAAFAQAWSGGQTWLRPALSWTFLGNALFYIVVMAAVAVGCGLLFGHMAWYFERWLLSGND
jgi:type IV secretory pathway VirB2 component (pilin)